MICHLTSAHPRDDIRIFVKECISLKKVSNVVLIVADSLGDEVKNGVFIYDVGSSMSRLDRIINAPTRVLEKAIQVDADIYHLHDPELIPIGLKLKKLGKIVIFDAHEDVPKQLLSKPYLNKPARWLLSSVFSVFERLACPKLDYIVTATPSIREKFRSFGAASIDVNNYPLLGELDAGEIDWSKKKQYVAYVGGIASIRGISQVVSAMNLTKTRARLQLAGNFNEPAVERAVHEDAGWQLVDALGLVNRERVREVLSQCVAGLVTFLPAPNHIDAQPNKMFEYMSAGLPIIGSHFSLWKEIIEGNDCGICVDPLNPQEIADAIDFLVNNPKEAERMGYNGQKAVQEKYNWGMQEQKLLSLYSTLEKNK